MNTFIDECSISVIICENSWLPMLVVALSNSSSMVASRDLAFLCFGITGDDHWTGTCHTLEPNVIIVDVNLT